MIAKFRILNGNTPQLVLHFGILYRINCQKRPGNPGQILRNEVYIMAKIDLSKYGISGKPIGSITYKPQQFDPIAPLYML